LVRFNSPAPSTNRLFFNAGVAFFSLDGGTTNLVNWGLSSDFADFLNPPNVPGAPPVDPFVERLTIGNTIATLTPLDIQVTDAAGFSSPVNNAAPPAATSAVMVLRGTVAPNNGTYAIYDLG